MSEARDSQRFYSHLLKSNCPVTGQPDWGTVVIDYEEGLALDPASLLRYLVAFRQHADFHEQCVERIYLDLWRLLKPAKLTVFARYVRRGGLTSIPTGAVTPSSPPRNVTSGSDQMPMLLRLFMIERSVPAMVG